MNRKPEFPITVIWNEKEETKYNNRLDLMMNLELYDLELDSHLSVKPCVVDALGREVELFMEHQEIKIFKLKKMITTI